MKRLLALALALLPTAVGAQQLTGRQWDMLERALVPNVLRLENGNTTTPAYSFRNATTAGAWISSAGAYVTSGKAGSGTNNAGQSGNLRGGAGTGSAAGGNASVQVAPGGASGSSLNAYQNALFADGGSGSIELGALDVLNPGTSLFSGANVVAGVTNGPGGLLRLASSVGTGSGAASSIRFETPTVGGSGTSQQSLAIRFTVATTDVTATVPILSTTDNMGWSVQAAANQACTTTCTSAAVLGFDTAVSAVPVGPADATADLCLCAGPS